MNARDKLKALPLVASMLGDKLGVRVIIGKNGTACTDGESIFLPPLPSEGTPDLLGLVNGYVDHEAAHIRHTEFEALKQSRMSPLERHLANTIEDWRVEHELVKRYPGCREHFIWLIRHIFLENSNDDEKAEATSPSAFSILNHVLLTLRSWDVPDLITEVKANSSSLYEVWPELMTELDQLLEEIPASCSSTKDSIALSKRIVRLIKEEAKKENSAPIKEAQEQETGSQEEGQDDSVPVLSPSENQGQTSQEQEETGPSDASDDQPVPFRQLTELLRIKKSELPESFDNQLEHILKSTAIQTGNGIGMARVGHIARSPLEEKDRIEALSSIRAMTTRLSGLLQSEVLRRSAPSRYGRLDSQRLHRIATNDPRLFRSNEKVVGIDTAVHILLDVSGSMARRIKLASLACYSVASSLSSIRGVNVGVTAFPALEEQDDIVTVCPLLKHGERMNDDFEVTVQGTTPLAEALWWVAKQLVSQKEVRKIVLLITDGEPDDFQAAQETVSALQKQGIEIIGVGIHSCRLSVFVEHQITITELSELAPAMLTLLQQTLLRKGGRP